MTPHIGDDLAAYIAGEVTDDERRAIAAHLAQCPTCRAALTEAQSIRRMLRSLRADAPAHPASLAEAVMTHLTDPLDHSGHAGARRPVSGHGRVLGASSNSPDRSSGAATVPSTPTGAIRMQPTPAPAPQRRRTTVIATVAAVLLIGLIGTLFAVQAAARSHVIAGNRIATPTPTSIYRPGRPIVTWVPGSPITLASSYASETDSAIPGAPVTPGKPEDVFLTDHFVYIIGNTNDEVKKGDVIAVKWYSNDNDITDSIKGASKTPNCCSFTIGAQQAGLVSQFLFRVTYPVATRGKAEIYYNNRLAAVVLFEVVDHMP